MLNRNQAFAKNIATISTKFTPAEISLKFGIWSNDLTK
jgi:hypothetical protein